MLKTPTRPKRSLEYDAHSVDSEHSSPLDFASLKRICIEPQAPSGSEVPTHITSHVDNYSSPSSLAKGQSQDTSVMREKLDDDDMDVGDDMVSNFNTISFNSSLLVEPQSQSREESYTASSSPSLSKDFPVFPPLQRSRRRIDHLVDEVIRKSSRYNPESLRLTIPPSDFEFHMPSHVSVCGSPTRDSRYISSPENRNLAVAAIFNATTSSPVLDTPTLIQQLSSEREGEVLQDTASSFSAAQYHLGDVTHSDWFESSNGNCDDKMCHSGMRQQTTFANHSSNCYNREYELEESDEEYCEDMYIDS